MSSIHRIIAGTFLLLAFFLAQHQTAYAGAPVEPGRSDYILHCSGCHGMDARGVAKAGIPALQDQVGYFLQLPEGRAFVMQVPGLLSANLSDERAARVVNWMIEYFAGESQPAAFVPYTAEEARGYRLGKPADIIGTRKAIQAKLNAAGYPLR